MSEFDIDAAIAGQNHDAHRRDLGLKPQLTNGCTGDCCETFVLSRSFEMMKRLLQQGIPMNGSLDETRFIVNMLIPVKHKDGHSTVVDAKGVRRFLYTCSHFDTKTRLCTVYNKRPALCRTFPNKMRCQDGCVPHEYGKPRGCQMTGGTDWPTAKREFKEKVP